MASEFTDKDERLIDEAFEQLLEDYSKTRHQQKVELITKAFRFARQAHKGVRRRSGEPYILHPIAVARIVVAEIGLGSTSICAALMHDVVEDTSYTVADIENLFGPKIASIVDGLTKISGGVFGKQASAQAENFRKLLLTMSEDIRVILIKIADRLHNMRTLEFQPLEKQFKIAGETQYIYAPLAHRLGLFAIKTELENLSFKYEHPDTYKEIEDKLNKNKDAQMSFFEEFSKPIREKLQSLGYEFDLHARIKSVYSIYNKMQAKNIDFEDVYDLLAVRIIFKPKPEFNEKDQCWMIYSALTEIYKPHPERIRDWISTPKANGYEALHVTVMGNTGQWVEVQIRTERMHEIAERGLAAHWKYKTGDAETELDKWLRQIKEILKNPEPNAMEFLDTFKLNLFASEVFVFTPNGDIKTLPQGATALDFAFMLHTDLGAHCIGAKVNHKLEPMSYVLQGGDQIEILTSREQRPQHEWLEITTTAKAQTRLKNYFRREERQIMNRGEEFVNDEIDRLGLSDQRETVIQQVLNFYGLKQPQQLYMEVGNGVIKVDNIADLLKPKQKNFIQRFFSFGNNDKQQETTVSTSGKKEIHHIDLTDIGLNKEYEIASCCHPIPGDEVLGYQQEDGIIEIHKRNCPKAMQLKANFGKRLYSVTWKTQRANTFLETIQFRGIDTVGVIIKMLYIISEQFKINIHDLHVTARGGIFEGEIELFVYDTNQLSDLCSTIRKIKEIQSVQRITQIEGLEDIADID